ncbi:22419_t:CDS:2, partial [Gigaspora rosea]
MPDSITVLYYVNDYRYNIVKSFQIVEALGIMNSQSLNSPQRILLKGFYNHDSPEEFNLPRFEKGNIVLAMNLAKEALTNSNEQAATFLPTNVQPEINDM